MSRKDTGLVGVAGSKDLTGSGVWWDRGNRLSGCVLHTDGKLEWPTAFGPFGPVLVVDGLLFFARKDTFNEIGGYTRTALKGFHFYDIDLSVRLHRAGYRNYTINLIVKHQSIGALSPEWEANRRQWLSANGADLPIHLPTGWPKAPAASHN